MGELRFDVAVVGAGPAGLAAASAAGRCGRSVCIVDMQAHPGGQIWRAHGETLAPPAARAWAECTDADVRWIGDTTIVDASGQTLMGVTPGGRARTIRAEQIVVATGARERLLPFPGWTLPGVVGAGGLQALVKSGLDLEGKRVVVAGSGPLLLAAAQTVRQAGGTLVGPFEHTSFRRAASVVPALLRAPHKLLQLAELGPRTVPHFDSRVVSCRRDGPALRATVRTRARERNIPCDLLAIGDGLVPQTRLACLLGCDEDQGRVVVDGLQRTTRAGVLCAGETTGIGGQALATAEGRVAGAAAGGDLTSARKLEQRARSARAFADALERAFAPLAADVPFEDTIVCRCESVTLAEIRAHPDARTAKLQTRCGMGPCQGRVCRPVLESLLDWAPPSSARPPLFPTPLGALAELWSESTSCQHP